MWSAASLEARQRPYLDLARREQQKTWALPRLPESYSEAVQDLRTGPSRWRDCRKLAFDRRWVSQSRWDESAATSQNWNQVSEVCQ